MLKLVFIALLAFLTNTQKLYAQPAANTDTVFPNCMQKASLVLGEAFVFMQKNYYRKNSVDWDSLMVAANKKLTASATCNETYDIISWCFKELNEKHSFILPPAKAAVYNSVSAGLYQKPLIKDMVGDIKGELLEDGIAYLTVPWVSTTDPVLCTLIADSLQQLIAALDARGTQGWIIDLRKNTGGNCWPMLAGIGPLLGNGVCGYFVTGSEKIPISYSDGAASQGKYLRCKTSNSGYKMKADRKTIVVLTGRKTVSSGEIIAMAFKGKEQVYLYGEPTAGYTTANATYTLSDNSMLVLTVCMEADRTGKILEGSIMPDEIFTTDTHPGVSDPAKSAAIMWLAAQR